MDQQAELRALVNASDVPVSVATRARIMLWYAEDRQKKEIAELTAKVRLVQTNDKKLVDNNVK
ncbi:hypothetical protein ACSNOI_00245 [Actinomadura kijaniata]|uniref:hypothetical protein n=1 Tax=Actinomadura kijaniata TaxID=46161 RepID=UPI003F1DC026